MNRVDQGPIHQINSNVMFDEYGKGEVATFGQLSSSQVYHRQCTVSNMVEFPKVDLLHWVDLVFFHLLK